MNLMLPPVLCSTPLPVKPPPPHFSDPCSFSQPGKIQTRHIHLDIHVDMPSQNLSICATYFFERLDPSHDQLILDARALKIYSVVQINAKDTRKLTYDLRQNLAPIGDALIIHMPAPPPPTSRFFQIQIELSTDGLGTSSAGGACDWLEPSHAASCPFVFTQCQSIHARSIFPCQDTPATKASYSARVTLDQASINQSLQVVMSAQRVSSLTRRLPHTSSQPAIDPALHPALFECNIPVPSYLFAFAVGRLDVRSLSPRCAVWALPHVVEDAQWEFQEVEKFLQIAEKIAGPYVWGRYDLLVLPSSYPCGGMENPMLTFVTPTLISGDRSLVNVVIHEICHSWTGNLVSCQDCTQFWINEGFTVKLERRIIRELYGPDHEGLHAIEGRRRLDSFIKSVGQGHIYTSLVAKIKYGDDPDSYLSLVAYEKGYNFLLLLEQYVEQDYGLNMDDFFRNYIDVYKYQSVGSEHFEQFFKNAYPTSWNRVNWPKWLYGTGPCIELAPVDVSLAKTAESVANSWIVCLSDLANKADKDKDKQLLERQFSKHGVEFRNWPAQQQICFLSCLLTRILRANDGRRKSIWTKDVARVVRDIYKLDNVKNCEVRFQWCRLIIASHLDDSLDNVVKFISQQGRTKFVRPIFNDLHYVYPQNGFAISLFNKLKYSYHSLTRKMIERDLKIV